MWTLINKVPPAPIAHKGLTFTVRGSGPPVEPQQAPAKAKAATKAKAPAKAKAATRAKGA